ncbi:MAG: FAD-binding oxidoreductase [Alteromonadaceae bacterium]|nr:FAD-binding oxidoreductase [Alteromonadaceae bacterium]
MLAKPQLLKSERVKLFASHLSYFIENDNIITRDIQRFAYGTDASFYRLIPAIVVRINTQNQLEQLILFAQKCQLPITFRAAGTSLSGQAITDNVLVLLSHHWQQYEIMNNGEQIKLQTGIIGAQANKLLQPYGRKIGPDPASINSCKIGGIAANNASGMCCGVKNNSYHTLTAINLVFADGSVLNTADDDSKKKFLATHPTQIQQLQSLAEQIKQNPSLLQRVQHKYRLKNTTGYGINALIDFDDPIDIISHLMIGSEGTLAFISDITYQTIAIKKYKSAGLYLFDDMQVACQLVTKLANEQVDAVEILDARALNSVASSLTQLLDFNHAKNDYAGLLIEFSADDELSLANIKHKLDALLQPLSAHLLPSKTFTQNTEIITQLWKIRKGMFPAIGANRRLGTTVVIEDIALPLDKLAVGVKQLHHLFTQFGYDEAIIFGHALAGNLHFVFTQSFDTPAEIKRYHDFMAAVCQMVAVDYKGSLKAEHGTGRNMAPFVELEWGSDLYKIMQQIKHIFDPDNLFNPDVIISDNPNSHIENLKAMPLADELIDQCIECGFCESVCPSNNLTLTPRQRIALWRRISQLQSFAKKDDISEIQQQELDKLEQDYQYFGIDSCAATGLCGQECPVGIDTGVFIKKLRAEKVSQLTKKTAQQLGVHFSALTTIAKFGLNSIGLMNKIFPENVTYKTFSVMNRLTHNKIPKWYPAWPKGAKKYQLKETYFTDKVVYIPSCANRIFAADNKADDQRVLPEVMHSLLTKAKISMIIPEYIHNSCCGMPWASKGINDVANSKRQAFIDLIMQASEQGELAIITDASPCALTLNQNNKIKIYEASEYIAKHVLSKLTIRKSTDTFMLHKTCSSIKMDDGKYLEKIARACSDNIIIPNNVHCCGFAGDKGFYLPELNKSALQALSAQIPLSCQHGLSNSRTCEIGLSEHSNISYQSFLYLLDQVSFA